MHRRTFVVSAMGVPLAGKAAPIRIGFLGATHSHARGKIQVVKESSDWELASVAADGPEAGKLLSDASVQVIAVESDNKDHYRHGRMALEAGKHVHLEKPPADSLPRFRELVDLAEKKRRILQMGYMWRYHPGINALLEAVRQGWLGNVYLVRVALNTLIDPARRKDWAMFRGGQMFELGSHAVDIVVRLLGRPDRVTPFLRKHGGHADNLADNTLAVLEYPRAMAVITSAALEPGAMRRRAVEVLGTNGTAVVRPIEPPEFQIELAKAAGPYKAGLQNVPMPPYRRYAPEFADLADAVRNNRPLAVTPQVDLAVHETLMRACEM